MKNFAIWKTGPELLTEEETDKLKDKLIVFDQNEARITIEKEFSQNSSENTLTLQLQKLSLNIVLLGITQHTDGTALDE